MCYFLKLRFSCKTKKYKETYSISIKIMFQYSYKAAPAFVVIAICYTSAC
jgi:hypothetical protein